jgi:hypothetical protein
MHFGAFGAKSAIGGITLSISHSFADHFNSFEEIVLSKGRCLCLRCLGPGVAILIVNLHLDPALGHDAKTKLLRDIKAESLAFPGYTMFLGDFNFIHSDEARCNIADPTQEESTSNPKLAAWFEECFCDFMELHQGAYTRRDTRGDLFTTLSRLDRLYTNLPPRRRP